MSFRMNEPHMFAKTDLNTATINVKAMENARNE